MFMARYAVIFLCHLIFMTFDIYDKGILNKQRAFSCFGGFTDPLKILKTSLPWSWIFEFSFSIQTLLILRNVVFNGQKWIFSVWMKLNPLFCVCWSSLGRRLLFHWCTSPWRPPQNEYTQEAVRASSCKHPLKTVWTRSYIKSHYGV